MKRLALFFLMSLLTTNVYGQKFDSLALTPPMGWNSWNTFQVDVHETLVKQIADIVVSSGMRDAGYTYIVIDGRQ